MMDIEAYLRRIGIRGQPPPNLSTLRQVQSGHLNHIPYENLDVQLGRSLTLSPNEAFHKLVTQRRGGWCYEMNGLLLWALETIGFEVLPMTGAVRREERGDVAIGNHLALAVKLDRYYIVDAGLGDGPQEPIPLMEGSYRDQWRTVSLERIEDGWWRFHNYENSFAASFDFKHEPADWKILGDKCAKMQMDPESVFVQNSICLRPTTSGFVMLLGRVMKTVGEGGIINKMVNSLEEYQEVLANVFGLQISEANILWPNIMKRHEVLFGS